MAIVICPECSKKISSYAEFCPNCDCPSEIIKNNLMDLQSNKIEYSKECTYQITLLNNSDCTLKLARYLQIFTNIHISEAMSKVSNLPSILFDDISEDMCNDIKYALSFYGAEFKIKLKDTIINKENNLSKKIICLETKNRNSSSRADIIYIAREYGFDPLIKLSEPPFIIRDGTPKEAAIKIQKELNNIGIQTQIINSATEIIPIVSSLAKPRRIQCPKCNSTLTQPISEKRNLIASLDLNPIDTYKKVTYQCLNCDYKWDSTEY